LTPKLQALAKAADERFPKLTGHGERTASYAVATAYSLGIPDEQLRALRVAAAIHYAWSDESECPCCERVSVTLTRWTVPDAPRAADLVRGMRANWNMVPLSASILAAACHFDLQRLNIDMETVDLRTGVAEALHAIAPLITPLDRLGV